MELRQLTDALQSFANTFGNYVRSTVPVKSGKLRKSVKSEYYEKRPDEMGTKTSMESYVEFLEVKPEIDQAFENQTNTLMSSNAVDDAMNEAADEEMKRLVESWSQKIKGSGGESEIKYNF